MLIMFWRTLSILVLAWFAHNYRTTGQTTPDCRRAVNCTSCILTGPLCGWCFQQGFVMAARCDFVDALESKGCNKSNIFVSKSEVTIVKNDALGNADYMKMRPAVRLAPQHVRVRLSPGKAAKFSMQFRVAPDYSVDLYYLMDVSLSMQDDLESLTRLGWDLRQTLSNITRNARLGFGVFVDKPVKPFISVRTVALDNPCYPIGSCTAAYGYINRLALTNDTDLFVHRVRSSAVTANLDGTEGGLDALVQAIVCQKDIGWRENSRKLLLYATDDTSHISGDGKLGGIVEPNDGLCHMVADRYAYSKNMDYPSYGQIASLVKEKSVHIIFAISESTKELYEEIARVVPGSEVAILSKNSSNVVELVKDNYQAIISTVSLAIDGLDDDKVIAITTSSSCGSGSSFKNRTCLGVAMEEEVTFDVQLDLTSCPASSTRGNVTQKVIFLSVIGVEEKLRIDVEIDCNCECNNKVYDSSFCSLRGFYSCGSCYCDEGFIGSRCDCEEDTAMAAAHYRTCIRPGSSQPCSGRGVCTVCGKCQCSCLPQGSTETDYCDVSNRYSGVFCDCNPKGCNSYNGLICSGQGVCRCDHEGKNYCECNEQFENGTLSACECPKSVDTCKSDGGEGAICNGKGVCTCGTCRCKDSCYTGATCSTLKPECSGSCQQFRPCIDCLLRINTQCPDNCQNVSVNMLDNMTPGSLQICHSTDDELCELTFALSFDHAVARHRVVVLKDRKCQPNLIILLVGGIVGATLIIGLSFLLIWKVAVTTHDRKEYMKFEAETKRAQWVEAKNPLFKDATEIYVNPSYMGRLGK